MSSSVSNGSPVPFPRWIDDIRNEGDRALARTRFLTRLAALYATPAGNLTDLALRIGYNHKHSLHVMLGRGYLLSPETCIAIEQAVGRDVVRREDMRPDLFLVDEVASSG